MILVVGEADKRFFILTIGAIVIRLYDDEDEEKWGGRLLERFFFLFEHT